VWVQWSVTAWPPRARSGFRRRRWSAAQVLNEQLTNALNSRIVIEQANGMVSEREALDMDASFRLLRNHARNHNLSLTDSDLLWA